MADPYRNFKFELEIAGFVRAGFQKVSGIKSTTTKVPYREGGDNDTPRKLVGQTEFDDWTLERGVSWDSDFQVWRLLVFNLDGIDAGSPPPVGFRRSVTGYLKDKAANRVKKYAAKRCWPCEDGIGDLDANASEVLMESLVIANEGYRTTTLPAAALSTVPNPFAQGL